MPTLAELAGQGMRGFTTGVLGGPVDLANMLMMNAGGEKPVMGSEWLGEKLEQLGLVQPRPQGAGVSLAELAGGMMGPGAPFKAAAALKPTLAMLLFHGSPHKFDKFDMSKIGTGEGAQAYGHGLYFAENKDVAKQYATDRSYVGKTMAGVPHDTKFDAPWIAKQAVDEHGDDAIKHLETVLRANSKNNHPAQAAANKEVEDAIALVRGGQVKPSSNLYKVDVPDEAIGKMLDWDKPLSQQPESVQKALQELGIKHDVKASGDFDDALLAALNGGSTKLPKQAANPTGEDIYRKLSAKAGSTWLDPNMDAAAQITNKLRALGITGIRYLDGGSRGKGGTSNFVVFDDSLPKIVERNGEVFGGAPKSLPEIRDAWQGKGVVLDAYENGSIVNVPRIVVPKEMRSQGIGTQAMQDLTSYADETGKTLTLSPSTDFGASSVDRLKSFYKKLGFVENKGKNKDFTISESMYRPPHE